MTGDQALLKRAVEEHRRLRTRREFRMLLQAAPAETERVFSAALPGDRHLVRRMSWARVDRRLETTNTIELIDPHGEVVAERSW